MKKIHKTPLAVAMTASLLPLAGIAQAGENPFALTEMGSAYLQTAENKTEAPAAKAKEGACGEGKCGAAMMSKSAPAAAAGEKKAMEGKCAGNKPAGGDTQKPAEATTGGK